MGCVHVDLGLVQQPHARLSNASHGDHTIAENFKFVENDTRAVVRAIFRAASRDNKRIAPFIERSVSGSVLREDLMLYRSVDLPRAATTTTKKNNRSYYVDRFIRSEQTDAPSGSSVFSVIPPKPLV